MDIRNENAENGNNGADSLNKNRSTDNNTTKQIKCELYNDNFQNYKRYAIPRAQLVIADLPYNCYDEKTECWTTDGWKKYSDLRLCDTVLSLNSRTREMEYSAIDKIIIKDNDEHMIHFTNMNLDLFVTESHRMYALKERKPQGKGIRKRSFSSLDGIRLAKDIHGGWYIPRSGYKWISHSDVKEIVIPSCEMLTNGRQYVAPEVHISLDKWLPFFGLWLADGCVCNSKAANGRQLYTISIKQGGDRRKVIMDMMKDLPFKTYEHREKTRDLSNINIYSKQLWLYLKQFGKSKEKHIPRWILDLPKEYLELFWKWYTFGDSSKNGKGIKISSVSKQLILDLQEIALKLGTISQIREINYPLFPNTLYYFQFNPNSKNICYTHKKTISDYIKKVWCIKLRTNSVFLVRRNGLIAFCGNCGENFYGSNPMWYNQGDRKNGESKYAKKAAFNTDYNFNIAEYFHFCNKLLKKDPTGKVERGRSSDAPCMIIFCSFKQMPTVIAYAAKYGYKNYIPISFIKNYSPQVLKANMRIVGATERALVFYRDKLPKFRNDGHMVFDWFEWKRDNSKTYPKIHPTQKPVNVVKRLIEIFTDEGDVVIDPVAGSASTLRAAYELGRPSYGFEVGKEQYRKAKELMLDPVLKAGSIAKTE